MRFTRLKLENWRNFKSVDVPLKNRVFVVGPNASGKSNLLDVFRFLRDIAATDGGFQRAVEERDGVSSIRSLAARRYPTIVVEVDIGDDEKAEWTYRLEFAQDNLARPVVRKEIVKHRGKELINRPDDGDQRDKDRLSQTHLEQVNANREFREVADFFRSVRYLHLVPQLVREPERSVGKQQDPYGGDFLEQLARTPAKTLASRLSRIRTALQVAVPQLEKLELERDKATGVPHLQGMYKHWRPNAGWQREERFSDGTLRLLGLLWVLLEGNSPLLTEEPELSLHVAVVRHLTQMMHRISRKSGRQMFVSTHSYELLSDPGIQPEEVLILEPREEGAQVTVATEKDNVRPLLEGGSTIAEAVLPLTEPVHAEQLALFET